MIEKSKTDEIGSSKKDAVKSWFRQDFVKVALLCVTSYFSWHAGATVTGNMFLGAFYILVIELPAMAWSWLEYDSENKTQEGTAGGGWIFSLVMVALTAIASGMFMAVKAAVFSWFTEIPPLAQVIGVILIPMAAAVQLFIYGIYRRQSDWLSEKKELERARRNAIRERERGIIAADTRIALATKTAMADRAEAAAPTIAAQETEKYFANKYHSDTGAVNPPLPVSKQ